MIVVVYFCSTASIMDDGDESDNDSNMQFSSKTKSVACVCSILSVHLTRLKLQSSINGSMIGCRLVHSMVEKKRRDKMTQYVSELSNMIPMCGVMQRKLDKITVLRMAVQHLKAIKGRPASMFDAHSP